MTMRNRGSARSRAVSISGAAALALLALSTLPVAAQADVVTDWNLTTLQVAAAAGLNPQRQHRVAAMVHAAMHDAVNSVAPRYRGLCRAGLAVRGSVDRGRGGSGRLRRADPAAPGAGGHAGRGPLELALQDPRRARQGRGPGGGRGGRRADRRLAQHGRVRRGRHLHVRQRSWGVPARRRRPSGTPASPPGGSSRLSCSSAATSSGQRVRPA